MMKRIFALLAALCLLLGCLAGCSDKPQETQPSGTQSGGTEPGATEPGATEPGSQWIDYAASVKLDMSSETVKQEVTVKAYIDGDTTHFNVPATISEGGLLKARYLAVNTPESTGKIEEWGKKASSFTKSRLETASSIIIESDDGNWNVDSTGGRYLVWVWYKPDGAAEYRNLNIELLQEGLSIASSAGSNRYGEVCMNAIAQAKANGLHMHSKEDDPDFYYGDSIPVTLKELRTNIELYENMKVAFEGVITYEGPQTVYVEEYDAETDMYFGMTVYYGYNLGGNGLKYMEPGNRVKFVGSVQYYATGGTWQVSDIEYIIMRPDDPNNVQLISSGHEASNRLTDGYTFKKSKVDMEVRTALDSEEMVMKTFDYGELALSTSISMEGLVVESVSTTTNEDSSNKGAMTLNCRVDGYTISVRTAVLYDENNQLITADAYKGKTINVKGIVDYYTYSGYQVKVFSPDDITIV
ncbi:MAG: thermonuclease family protein [Oscillospiraceae bacterium]|nr:thermonuclease family protein [Oscillospiraceae bacterium]